MRKSFIKQLAYLSITICVVGLVPSRAFAWGGTGHRTVAEIAVWRLQKLKAANALRQIEQLLKSKPTTIEEASVWPDTIRGNPVYQYTTNLHWVSIPKEKERFDRATQCKPTAQVPEGDCVIGALEHFRKVLSDSSASTAARLDALSFIVHFIGDLHQPLHATEDVTFQNYNGQTGDAGGNLKIIFYLNEGIWADSDEASCTRDIEACSYIDFQGARRKRNLHAAWDSYLIETMLAGIKVKNEKKCTKEESFKLREQRYTENLERTISKLSSQEIARMELGEPSLWAEEAHALATEYVYCLPPPRRKLNVADQKIYDHYFLSQSYQAANIKRIDAQLMRAGIRLAAYLMQIFPDTP
ncbi:MAG TPA: S1/P1 nuclease [Pyrinomonadaceae bacterium]|nr:S1/P1 nuclease [Pyrinomonadaceae bacterium]